jgi:hypothetical protein
VEACRLRPRSANTLPGPPAFCRNRRWDMNSRPDHLTSSRRFCHFRNGCVASKREGNSL